MSKNQPFSRRWATQQDTASPEGAQPPTRETTDDRPPLPNRVVLDAAGHYWLDWGTHLSMCPTSDNNDLITIVAEFAPLREAALPEPPLDVAWQAAWDALPSPSWSVNVRRRSRGGRWEAWAQDLADDRMPPIIRIGEGDTEAASLLDVAARLRDSDSGKI